MPYEYLASVQSAVRRVNDRLQKLSDIFGADSSIVGDYKAQLDVIMGDNFRLKDGVPQIYRPLEIYNDAEKSQALQSLDENVRTWGSYRKEYGESYERYKEESEFFGDEPVDIGKYIQTREKISDAFQQYDSKQLPEQALEIMKKTGGRKSYKDLEKVITILTEKGLL